MKSTLRFLAALSLCLSILSVHAERLVLVGASYGKNILAITDAEGEVPLHKVVYEYFALQQGAKGSTQRSRMDACVTKARALCEAGARVDHRNKYGDTPLLAAAQTDAAEIASVLLEYGSDLTAKNRQGYAPLLMAASENRPAAVAVLTPEMVARRKSLDDRSGCLLYTSPSPRDS